MRVAKDFATDPFETISLDRARNRFLGDRESESGVRARGSDLGKAKQFAATPSAPPENPFELGGLEQTTAAGKLVAGYVQSARRLRPLARRRARTARPPLVAMRARNPWVRLRLIADG